MDELRPRTLSEMEELLDELDRHLDGKMPAGTAYQFFAVGGIAMAAIVDQRSTQDIDVVTAAIPKTALKAIRSVAKANGIPETWMNNQVEEFVDVELPAKAFQEVYSGRNIHLRGAKPEYMLGLKLMAGRAKDLLDIVLLAEVVGATSSDSLLAAYDEVYTGSPTHATQRVFVQSVCNDMAPIVRAHIAGQDIAGQVEALAAVYEGSDDLGLSALGGADSPNGAQATRRERKARRREERAKRRPALGKCGAPTNDGWCNNPRPPQGGKCSAGHSRPG